MEFIIQVKPPFSLSSIIRSHGWIQLAPFVYEKGSDHFSYITKLASGEVQKMRVQQDTAGVRVAVPTEITAARQAEIERIITWMLALDMNFSEFYDLASQEPKLAYVTEQAAGRILRSATLFEDTIKTILTTNTAWSGTIRMVQGMVDHFGEPLPSNSDQYAFPTPEKIATANEDQLRAQVRVGYRAPYILELARSIDCGDFDLESLKTSDMHTSDLRKTLLSIKGVGEYAAANLLMLLGRYDYFPIDTWAYKVISHEWYAGNPIGKDEVEAAFEEWGNWKGLAYWFWNWTYQG